MINEWLPINNTEKRIYLERRQIFFGVSTIKERKNANGEKAA